MKTNPNDPAFLPSANIIEKGDGTCCTIMEHTNGLTKRELFAKDFTAAIASHHIDPEERIEKICKIGIKLADAFIQKLNEGKENETNKI